MRYAPVFCHHRSRIAIALTVSLLSGPVTAWNSDAPIDEADYDDGWEAGWDAAFKERGKLPPLPSLAPLPALPRPGDDRSDFERGYLEGIRRAQDPLDDLD